MPRNERSGCFNSTPETINFPAIMPSISRFLRSRCVFSSLEKRSVPYTPPRVLPSATKTSKISCGKSGSYPSTEGITIIFILVQPLAYLNCEYACACSGEILYVAGAISPYFPRSSKKGNVRYNTRSSAETNLSKRTLRDPSSDCGIAPTAIDALNINKKKKNENAYPALLNK